MNNKYFTGNGNGLPVDSMSGTVPIIKEKENKILHTIGTGFYLTRYGLVVTAGHVVQSLISNDNKNLITSFVCHPLNKSEVNLRRILAVSFLNEVDLGILQVENYCEELPQNPLSNLKVNISPTIPKKGDKVVTFAYPENEEMDFSENEIKRTIKGDFYGGKFIRFIKKSKNPFIPHPYFETSIKVKSGASGGPVFYQGKVIGVNCRGWDFGEDIPQDQNLSSIIPISKILPLKFKLLRLPKISWEYQQLSEEQRNCELTILDLINAGHISYVK